MLTPNSNKVISRIAKEKFNMEFRYHHLRHTFCTILSDNNCNLKYISEAAGHSNEKFTFDRYIHTTEKMRDESVAIIDKVFGFDFPHTAKIQ